MTKEILDRDKLVYNETTKETYEYVRLEKDDMIYLECPYHGILQGHAPLRFKVFFGDSLDLMPFPCPKCLEKAREEGRKEMEKEPWKKIIDLAESKIKE